MVTPFPVQARFQAGTADSMATNLVEAIDETCPTVKAAVLVFNPADPPEQTALHSSASADSLIPRLRAVLERLESGSLRLPVDDGVRWVDVEGESV